MVKFPLGHLVATPAAVAFAELNSISLYQLVDRHVVGDDGDLDSEDKARNVEALESGGRIFSSYAFGNDKIWIITEADRSSTCVLLPSDY